MITSSMEIFSQIRSENSSHEPSAQCACFDILNKTGFWWFKVAESFTKQIRYSSEQASQFFKKRQKCLCKQ